MPTTFATTTFTVLVTINSYGALSPVDKSVLPPGTSGPILWNVDQCNYTRGKMEHPEKYTCQVFTSAKSTAWTYVQPSEGATGATTPPPPQENLQPDTNPERRSEDNPVLKSKDDVQLAGGRYHYSKPIHFVWVPDDSSKVRDADKPFIEPRVEPNVAAERPAARPSSSKTRTAARRPQQQPQFNPIGALVSLLTPRDW